MYDRILLYWPKPSTLFFFLTGIVQSMQSGWFFQSVFIFAAKQGFSLESLPWLTLYSLPYTFKWLLAPVADYLIRKGYSYARGVGLLLWGLSGLWLILFLKFEHIDLPFWIVMGLAALICSNLDNWLDAYRIKDFPKELQTEILRANILGYRLGLGFFTGFLVLSTSWLGWRWCFILFSLLCLMSALWVANLNQQSSKVPEAAGKSPALRTSSIFDWRILTSAVMIRAGDTWIQALIVAYLIYYKSWDSHHISVILQIGGGIASMLGVWSASKLMKYLSLAQLLWYGTSVSALLVLCWLGSQTMPSEALMVLVLAWSYWIGLYGFFFSQWLVENTCRVLPGTHFSVLTSVARLPTAAASYYGLPLLATQDFYLAFGLSFVGYACSLLLQSMSNHRKRKLLNAD